MKKLLFAMVFAFVALHAVCQTGLDRVRKILEDAPVQEKVYLHLDNNSYYKGDTIWYKSYVVRADNLDYTDMSKLVYVELVSPDGLVVERQQLIASADGLGYGNFALKDSLYSGYYELRAYTRWMLNFCVTEHPNTRADREQFYNRQMARDFFRQYGTIYSRVVPVYERPETPGGYEQKHLTGRPKTRLDKEKKENLTVNFYPEGGSLIAGTRCNIAFEALNEEGKQVDVSGRLDLGGKTLDVKTIHQGRGVFTVDVPENGALKATFNYEGKEYAFNLPKTSKAGCSLHVDAVGDKLTAEVSLRGLDDGREYALAVLCRGVLKHFQTFRGSQTIEIDKKKIPTGVSDMLVIDENGNPLADRLFFVNHHDYDMQPVTVEGVAQEYQPYAPITLQFKAPQDTKHISISVRDKAGDDQSFDTGNMMTDLLLSSDLKGFIAYPDYYFEADDETHRQHLDLLMMVQGWRRYDYAETVTRKSLRYKPEKTMTVEGAVYKNLDFAEIEENEVPNWLKGVFGVTDDGESTIEKEEDSDQSDDRTTTLDGSTVLVDIGVTKEAPAMESVEEPDYGINHGGLKYEVTVEGDLVQGQDAATVQMETTDGGHFSFNVPTFFGDAFLFLEAYKSDASEKKVKKLHTRGVIDEDQWPEFYVKRDLFYPVFAKKYDYYQCHRPDGGDVVETDDELYETDGRISQYDRELDEISVDRRRRRGRRQIDYTKPVYEGDAYELYNLATDYGLSCGKLNFRRFPKQVGMLLLGNYNSARSFNVEGRMIDDVHGTYTFYRSYEPIESVKRIKSRLSNNVVARNLKLKRQDKIRLFTDFELRNEDEPKEQNVNGADVNIDFVLIPEEGTQYTYRDRHILLHGLYLPDDFYHPDYSGVKPGDGAPKDYRRTLYWNPDARLDGEGRFTATFYNNGKRTNIGVSTAGAWGK